MLSLALHMHCGNMFIQGTHAFNDSKIPFIQARVLDVEGAPVQGMETRRFDCNVSSHVLETIKDYESWTYSSRTSFKSFITSHPTTDHPHPLLLNNQLLIQRTGDGLSRA